MGNPQRMQALLRLHIYPYRRHPPPLVYSKVLLAKLSPNPLHIYMYPISCCNSSVHQQLSSHISLFLLFLVPIFVVCAFFLSTSFSTFFSAPSHPFLWLRSFFLIFHGIFMVPQNQQFVRWILQQDKEKETLSPASGFLHSLLLLLLFLFLLLLSCPIFLCENCALSPSHSFSPKWRQIFMQRWSWCLSFCHYCLAQGRCESTKLHFILVLYFYSVQG